MRKKILSIALLTGAVIGIGGGAAHIAHRHHHHRDRMMRHVARTCVDAARDLDRRGPPRHRAYDDYDYDDRGGRHARPHDRYDRGRHHRDYDAPRWRDHDDDRPRWREGRRHRRARDGHRPPRGHEAPRPEPSDEFMDDGPFDPPPASSASPAPEGPDAPAPAAE